MITYHEQLQQQHQQKQQGLGGRRGPATGVPVIEAFEPEPWLSEPVPLAVPPCPEVPPPALPEPPPVVLDVRFELSGVELEPLPRSRHTTPVAVGFDTTVLPAIRSPPSLTSKYICNIHIHLIDKLGIDTLRYRGQFYLML